MYDKQGETMAELLDTLELNGRTNNDGKLSNVIKSSKRKEIVESYNLRPERT